MWIRTYKDVLINLDNAIKVYKEGKLVCCNCLGHEGPKIIAKCNDEKEAEMLLNCIFERMYNDKSIDVKKYFIANE